MFGLGNSLYTETYNVVGEKIDKWLEQLGAERYSPLGQGDENVIQSLNGNIEADFDHWCEGVLHLLRDSEGQTMKSTGCGNGNDCCSKKTNKKKSRTLKRKVNESDDEDVTRDSNSESDEPVVDLEDLGSFVRVERDSEEENEEDGGVPDGEPRAMLTPQLRESLSKQGYRLIGTHSGVKLCRWTKVKKK